MKDMKHQRQALRVSKGAPSFALLMEMGTGKTRVALRTAAYLWAKGNIDGVVVLTPNGIQQNWVLREIPTHLDIPYVAEYYSASALAWQSNKWKQFVKTWGNPDSAIPMPIAALNYESIITPKGYKRVESLLKRRRCLLILDESQRIKTLTAVVTRSCMQLRKLVSYARILTGTPLTNSPLDLFSQFNFLDPNILKFGTRYITAFRAMYAKTITRLHPKGPTKSNPTGTYLEITGYHNLGDLRERIKPYSFFATKKECLDLPPVTYTNLYADMTPQQRRIYGELKTDAIALIPELKDATFEEQLAAMMLDDGVVRPDNALVTTVRMQQLMGGFVKDEAGNIQHVKSNRPGTVAKFIDDLEGKAIIWCNFTAEIEELATMLREGAPGHESVQCVTYYGKTSDAERTIAVDEFQEGEARVFIGHPAAGSLGLTLTAATTVIWYSATYNAGDYWQGNARPHRIGQVNPVTVVRILSRGSLDAAIYRALKSKENMAVAIIEGEPT